MAEGEKNKLKFLLFGTGEYYNRYKIWFEKEEIAALVDNSKEKQGKYIDDILVISPEDIFRYTFDALIILSFYVRDMKAQLMDLGVEADRIYHFFDLHKLIYRPSIKRKVSYYKPDRCYELEDNFRLKKEDNRKGILLLSQDLTLGGPAIALYHAAQILIKRGYQVVYGSMIDGPLRKILSQEKIPVIVDENLMIETMKECEWVREYSLVICNTMNFHVFLSEREKSIPVAWWLHDALFFYDGVSLEVMSQIVTDNMRIWSVGPIPKRAVRVFRPDFYVEDLFYGVSDKYGRRGAVKQNKKMRFTVIGYIEYRKGQDILLETIKKLEPDIRGKAEFFFVGQNTSLMAKKIMDTAANIPEIMITGPVDREEIDYILAQTDILVCPSREDPMPTVAAEAMMHGVPCLISDAAGTASYIESGVDGLIFESENAAQLEEMLKKCILNSFDLKEMGRKARNLFEDYFSMEAFEKRFMNLIENIEF